MLVNISYELASIVVFVFVDEAFVDANEIQLIESAVEFNDTLTDFLPTGSVNY